MATPSAARFLYPSGVAVDPSGNVYVADTYNHTIRKGTIPIADRAIIDSGTGPVGTVRQLDTTPQTAVSWQWSVIRCPAGSVAALSSTSIRNPTFTPDVPDLYVFRLIAADASGALSVSSVNLIATNTPPTISDIPDQTTDEDTPVGPISFTVGDAETPANPTVTGTSGNTTLVPDTNIVFGGSGTDRTVTITPAANQHGTVTITVTVSDGSATSSDTFVLTVNPVNDPPVASDQNVTTAEDTPKAITLTATDADGDALTYVVVSGPSHGTLSGTAPNLTYTPDADYSGADSFTFKANDGAADSNVATVSITVTAVNDAPVIQSGPAAAPNPAKYGETVNFSVAATDADDNTLSYSWNFGDVTTSTQEDPTHVYAAPGTYNVTVTVSDGKGGTATGSVTVTVTADPLTLGGLKISREFAGKRRLKIQAKGQIQVPAGISPDGTAVELDVAGVVVSGVMDGKGKIALENLKFSLKPKWLKKADGSLESVAGPAKFKASILESDADWADELDAAGLDSGVSEWAARNIPFSLSVGANHYSAVRPGQWKATGEKGKFKGPVD